MIIKRKLYPSTERLGKSMREVVVTEKLDGSNLSIGKYQGEIYIATRNNIFKARDYKDKEIERVIYKGLKDWLDKHLDTLEEVMVEGSWMVGEWIGMAHIKYPFNFTFNMFAKANVKGEMESFKNINYNRYLFKYVFVEQEIPEFIRLVPVVAAFPAEPTIEEMDKLYDSYAKDKEDEHQVEGFIVILDERLIKKYVRLKRGKLQDHFHKNGE